MRKILLSLLSVIVWLSVAPAAQAYFDVNLPPLANCPASSIPPGAPGTTTTYPGRWWNPKRNGTGWDLVYSSDHTSMVAYWYTFNQVGRPVWLQSESKPLTVDGATGALQWRSTLYQVNWTHDDNGHGYKTSLPVGSVAMQFPAGSQTRAALAWQWDVASYSQAYNECIYDIFREAAPTTAQNGINESYTGNWYDPPHTGWGFDLIVGIDKNNNYTEVDTVQIYDVAGNAVWLQAESHTGTSPPPADNSILPYSPYQLRYIRGNGVPTVDCTAAPPVCFSFYDFPSTSIARNFTGPNSAIVTITANVPPWGGEPAIAWPMDDVPVTSNNVVRGTEVDRITTDQVYCDITLAQPTCKIIVSWTTSDNGAMVYRHNMVSGALTLLTNGPEGDFQDTLSGGDRFRYELKSAYGYLYSSTPDIRVRSVTTPPAPTLPAVPAADAVSDSVGFTGGQFRVDEGGSATYSVPLNLPPGRGGLTPALAMSYSSSAGDGVMGFGWSLEGVSTISKCRKTIESGDGANGTIEFAAGSPSGSVFHSGFCLDGQRLLLVSGVEGRVGAEYRTEVESFQKVVIDSEESFTIGSANYFQPVAFSAYRKDGTILKFGGNARRLSSTVEGGQSSVIASEWWQNELRDTNGNSVSYSYVRDSSNTLLGSLRLKTISYVGGAVSLEYDDRNSPWRNYGYTVPVVQNEWLNRIDVSTGRSYRPTYEASPYNPYIKRPSSLQECAGAVCYALTVFGYSNPPVATAAQSTQGSGFSNLTAYKYGDVDGDGRTDIVWSDSSKNLYVSFSRPTTSGIAFATKVQVATLDFDEERSWQLLDFNADGREDLLVYQTSLTDVNKKNWQVRLSDGNGFVPTTSYTLPGSEGQTSSVSAQAMLADFDGDGLTDVLVSEGQNSNVRAWFLRSNPGGGAQPYVFSTKADVVFDCSPATFCPFGVLLQFDRNHPEAIDFDGNGLSDIAWRFLDQTSEPDPGKPEVVDPEAPATSSMLYRFTNAGLVSGRLGTQLVFKLPNGVPSWSGSKNQLESMRFADINGDGLTDMAWRESSDNWVYQLTMSSVSQPLTNKVRILAADKSCGATHCDVQFLDFDGDGRLDFWIPATNDGSADYAVYVWSGSGFDQVGQMTFAHGRGVDWVKSFADLDGDGYYDNLLVKGEGGSWEARRTSGHHTARNVLNSISQGLGGMTMINYAPLTYSSVYSREYSASPLVYGRGSAVLDLLTPRFVVNRVSSSAPTESNVDAMAEVRYRYASFRMQGGGRGSLGFARLYTLDPSQGLETRTNYKQNFPFIGVPFNTYAVINASWTDACASGPEAVGCMVYGGGWTDSYTTDRIVSQSTEMVASRDIVGLGAKSKFVYKTYSSTVKADLLGKQLSREYTSGMVYDDYGNLTASSTTSYDANMLNLRTVTTSNTYNNDTGRWLLGRLLTSQVTTTRSSGDAPLQVTRNTSFDYDARSGQLLVERLQPGASGDLALTKIYTYDAYGNRLSQATCSGDVAETTCSNMTGNSVPFHGATSQIVQRYARTVYDIGGVFANETRAPFWNGSSSTEKSVALVEARDSYGNPTRASDANGMISVAGYGSLGRKYFEGNSTGSAVTTILRWCNTVSGATNTVPCPNYATYRVQTNTVGAPTTWLYFDRLDREVFSLRQGLDSTQYFAARKIYDQIGRLKKVSEPYSTSFGPTSGFMGLGTIFWTVTTYDSIGRVTRVDHPNGGFTTIVYDGLTTTTTLPVNKAVIAETKTETRTALGELYQVTDKLGSTITFTYDGAGNVTRTARSTWDGKNVATQATYDVLGRKLTLNDPDAGAWTYAYNALGEVIQKSSASNCTATFYDALGRMWYRADFSIGGCSGAADAVSTWTYDTAANGVGKIAQVSSNDSTAPYLRTHTYDGIGREIDVATSVLGNAYHQLATFDQYGRTYQSLFNLNGYAQTGELYQYNAQGYQTTVRDAYPGTDGQVYYEVQAIGPRGNVTQERHAGNANLVTTRQYDMATGRLKNINTANGTLQNLTYDYDTLGNLSFRQDTSGGIFVREEFQYDGLQRLTEGREKNSNGTDRLVRAYSYDGLGNLLTSPNNTGQVYGGLGSSCGSGGEVAAGPGALTASNGYQYCFDNRGNMLRVMQSTEKKRVTYTAFDLPREMRSSITGHTTQFRYGPERQRMRRLDYTSSAPLGSPTITDFVGNAEIIQKPGDTQREVKRYLPGLVLSQTVNVNGSGFSTAAVKYEYLLTDNLGSTHRIVDTQGTVYNSGGKQAFDAFGRRADADSGGFLTPAAEWGFDTSLTHHGFTGHEELDEFNWIHMNGRLYDAQNGRFLQADPMVSDPTNLQNLNRYTYVLNNPLAYTDPTGYWGKRQQGYVRTAAAIVISICTAGVASGAMSIAGYSAATVGEGIAVGAIGGFAAGAVATGTAKGALIGAFTGAVGGGVAQTSWANSWGGIAVNATAGGITSELNGGTFGSGFVSAGLSGYLAPHMQTGNAFQDGLSSAVMGGTVSALTGGKFANGAITSAFSSAIGTAVRKVSARQGIYRRMAAAASYNRETATAFEFEFFAFAGLGAHNAGPFKGVGEGIGLLGYSSKTGGYAEAIGAVGYHLGGEANYYAHLEGVAVATGGDAPEWIILDEIGMGVEVPFVAGAGASTGTYRTNHDMGMFVSANGAAAFPEGFIGFGGSVDITQEVAWLWHRAFNRSE